MTVTSSNYSLKTTDIEVVRFAGNPTELAEIRTWVTDALVAKGLETHNVYLTLEMGTTLQFSYVHEGAPRSYVTYIGDYLVKDSDGLVYRIGWEELNAFYKPSV